MTISIVTRSFTIGGRRIDISFEDAFWISLDEIARVKSATTSKLVAAIDAARDGANLSSAIRVYVLEHFLMQAKSLEGLARAHNREPQMPTLGPIRVAKPRWLN
jgi:predicted DNA-binding ribbon-helix-helix protein